MIHLSPLKIHLKLFSTQENWNGIQIDKTIFPENDRWIIKMLICGADLLIRVFKTMWNSNANLTINLILCENGN